MKTFRYLIALFALSTVLAACGPESGDGVDTIDIQTAADGGAPDAQPAAEAAGNTGAGGAPAIHCRSFGKFGDYCTVGK